MATMWSESIIDDTLPKGHNYLGFPWRLTVARIEPGIYRIDDEHRSPLRQRDASEVVICCVRGYNWHCNSRDIVTLPKQHHNIRLHWSAASAELERMPPELIAAVPLR